MCRPPGFWANHFFPVAHATGRRCVALRAENDPKNLDSRAPDFKELQLGIVKKINDLIVANVADNARLFSDLNTYRLISLRREFKLAEFVQGEDTASGVMSAVYGTDSRGTETYQVTFRRIDGFWFFGLDDERVAQFEKWDAQEQD